MLLIIILVLVLVIINIVINLSYIIPEQIYIRKEICLIDWKLRQIQCKHSKTYIEKCHDGNVYYEERCVDCNLFIRDSSFEKYKLQEINNIKSLNE